MNMLYLWHARIMEDASRCRFMITRGDSNQVSKGSQRFIAEALQALGIDAEPTRWTIETARSNYFGDYSDESEWESRWDLVWRVTVDCASIVRIKDLDAEYIGVDLIDDYSPEVEKMKEPPFLALAVAGFDDRAKAEKAAASLARHPEADGPEAHDCEIVKVARGWFVYAGLGSGGTNLFQGPVLATALDRLRERGGRLSASSAGQ